MVLVQADHQAARLTIASGIDYPTTVDTHGDHATVTMYWQIWVDFTERHPGGAIGYSSEAKPWTATADHERDGWRLTSLTPPPLCATPNSDGTTSGYLKC